jgi:hypothetical protein
MFASWVVSPADFIKFCMGGFVHLNLSSEFYVGLNRSHYETYLIHS